MALHRDYYDVGDLPAWEQAYPASVTAGAGTAIAYDLRKCIRSKDPYVYHWTGTTQLYKYHKANDSWYPAIAFTAVGGAIAAGSAAIFVASHGPAGTIAGTPTTSSFTFAALPFSASVPQNAFANAGDRDGYKIRVIGKSVGKIEERYIVGNTSGTAPIVYLDSPLSFTPVAGTDTYELLSGRVYLLGSGTTAAGFFKAYDVATDTISGNLSVTNLPATIGTDSVFVSKDEQLVPAGRLIGEGFHIGTGTYDGGSKGCLTATAATATTITGQTSGGDFELAANRRRNFQIRIVEDTTNLTAVGQRRKIISHTGGAGVAPVYTVSAWSVTPSANAKFVIEGNNDILLWTSGATATYSYAAGGYASDANWSTAAVAGGATQYANPPVAHTAGTCAEWAFSINPDSRGLSDNSFIWWFRGAAQPAIYYLDVSAGANGVWSSAITNAGKVAFTLSAGSCSAHAPVSNDGRYIYLWVTGTQILRFDMLNLRIEPWLNIPQAGGTAAASSRMFTALLTDGSTSVGWLYNISMAGTIMFRCELVR